MVPTAVYTEVVLLLWSEDFVGWMLNFRGALLVGGGVLVACRAVRPVFSLFVPGYYVLTIFTSGGTENLRV